MVIRSFKKSYSSSGVQQKCAEKVKEKKVEKNLTGNSSYEYKYYNGKNHLSIDCMLARG